MHSKRGGYLPRFLGHPEGCTTVAQGGYAMNIPAEVIEVYKRVGHGIIKDFPNEYLLMGNETTHEYVRLYYNGHVEEYQK